MAQFQQTVIEYLEQYQPEEYERLKAKKCLRARVVELATSLYETVGYELRQLQAEHPDTPRAFLEVQAEELAIAALLPLPSDGTSNDGKGAEQ